VAKQVFDVFVSFLKLLW